MLLVVLKRVHATQLIGLSVIAKAERADQLAIVIVEVQVVVVKVILILIQAVVVIQGQTLVIVRAGHLSGFVIAIIEIQELVTVNQELVNLHAPGLVIYVFVSQEVGAIVILDGLPIHALAIIGHMCMHVIVMLGHILVTV